MSVQQVLEDLIAVNVLALVHAVGTGLASTGVAFALTATSGTSAVKNSAFSIVPMVCVSRMETIAIAAATLDGRGSSVMSAAARMTALATANVLIQFATVKRAGSVTSAIFSCAQGNAPVRARV